MLRLFGSILWVATATITIDGCSSLWAQPSQPVESIGSSQQLDRLLTSMVLEQLPHTYVDEKKWGIQDERWDGIEWEVKNGRLTSHRRRKLVNHGKWQRFSATLINPDREFSVNVVNMRQLPDGKMAFDVQFTAHLEIHGRQSKWVKGVQLYSLSAEGHAKIALLLSMELATHLDITKFPPDLIFDPVATAADIEVQELRLDRISKAGGEFSQQVSRSVRKNLDEKIAEKEQKLVEKVNNKLQQNKRKLRLSLADAVESKWSGAARAFLPEPIQAALGKSGK